MREWKRKEGLQSHSAQDNPLLSCAPFFHRTRPTMFARYYLLRFRVNLTETYAASGITNFFTSTDTVPAWNSSIKVFAISVASVSINFHVVSLPKPISRRHTAS